MQTQNPNGPDIRHDVLDQQRQQWETSFSQKPEMFGASASAPARWAATFFKREQRTKLLELGPGQGRDTFFFATNGFQVTTVDYSQTAIDAIAAKAQAFGVTESVKAMRHDVRTPLLFEGEVFDACYSHMLYCMALTTTELERLSEEVRRVLKPGGLSVYAVRHTGDEHYGKGIHRGEDMYEVGGFIVHFFTREKAEHLARGYEIVAVDEFEEGGLPRKLFRVTLRKPVERR